MMLRAARERWPDPPRQPSGSMDCEGYATAYVARLFGHSTTAEDVLAWAARTKRTPYTYLDHVLGLEFAWTFWPGVSRFDRSIAYSNRPGFREWCEAYLRHGCVAVANRYVIPDYSHAIVFLDANVDGVLIADSVRGLVRDPWHVLLNLSDRKRPSRVDAWIRLPDAKEEWE